MSRGLGRSQTLILSALASLEVEYRKGGEFYVWVVVDRVYALSPEMQERKAVQEERSAAEHARIQAMADAGDDRAKLYLGLTRSLRRTRRAPRRRRTSPWNITETAFNPSRVIAALERRGLVARNAVQGGGSVKLTDQGRQIAASLSVGTTLPPPPCAR